MKRRPPLTSVKMNNGGVIIARFSDRWTPSRQLKNTYMEIAVSEYTLKTLRVKSEDRSGICRGKLQEDKNAKTIIHCSTHFAKQYVLSSYKVFYIFKAYFRNFETNTRHVCIYSNAFSWWVHYRNKIVKLGHKKK